MRLIFVLSVMVIVVSASNANFKFDSGKFAGHRAVPKSRNNGDLPSFIEVSHFNTRIDHFRPTDTRLANFVSNLYFFCYIFF